MNITFKEYLIEATKKRVSGKEEKKEVRDISTIFNPNSFFPKMQKVLNMMIKADNPLFNELVMLEMLGIFKQVLTERLQPYSKAGYEEKKGEAKTEHAETLGNITDEIKDVITNHFVDSTNKENKKNMVSVINRFMTLIVSPIMTEIKKATPHSVMANPDLIDATNFDYDAKDAFGALARVIVNSEIKKNADDASVATTVVAKWASAYRSTEAYNRMSPQKRIKKRLSIIASVAKRVQKDK